MRWRQKPPGDAVLPFLDGLGYKPEQKVAS
jgi:hypothetical protein